MRLLALALAGAVLSGCAAGDMPDWLAETPPITMHEIQLAAYVAGVEIGSNPAEMSDEAKRAVVGFCLAQRRISSPFDDAAAAYCAEAEAALLAPLDAPLPPDKPAE